MKQDVIEVNGPIHIMFLMVDHFEPTKQENVNVWLKRYPEIASKYSDSDGFHPRYTWFFPIEQKNDILLRKYQIFAKMASAKYKCTCTTKMILRNL